MQRLHEWKVDMLTLRGLPAIHRNGAEVSRSHSKPATSCLLIKQVKAEASQKDEGLNDKMKEQVKLTVGDKSRNI